MEDDENDVYFTNRAFRDVGVSVPIHVANDGMAAVEFLSNASHRGLQLDESRPCLVLLDLNLPYKSGLEVLKWIRQESDWKTMPVVILTSSVADSDKHAAYLLGANSYLVKPADATKLKVVGEFVKTYWLQWNESPPLPAK